jgi:hypothetical protein
MKAALAGTPKHDFAFPAGEVQRVTLCDTGRSEVFLSGTVPSHTCGDGSTPAPVEAPVKPAAPAAKIAPATPAAPAAPADAVGDGQTFQTLDSNPPAGH